MELVVVSELPDDPDGKGSYIDPLEGLSCATAEPAAQQANRAAAAAAIASVRIRLPEAPAAFMLHNPVFVA